MNTIPGTYQQQLLLALRLLNVPGPRIAEALAEVDSHVAETGEDAYQAFGEPKAYAEQIARALGSQDPLSWRGILRSMTWRDGVTFLAFLSGSALVFQAVARFGAGSYLWLPVLELAGGLGLLTFTVVWIARRTRRHADWVLDPRTGRNMAPSLPRWTVLLWVLYPGALLLLAYISGSAGR
jgi:hypothetical protein